ncbi:MAG: hypothetical protein COV72_06805 [Candidatus Omnitrophica bacterium CG11_big_fil_rev_8_21_14_0_20_42_13]|uniref:LptD C-terminal domain-containing protein n=1 Tax=Candidatus Ghiorseimicrobium undicola TaxID=1974746 RepID=A0A2H0LWM4_9BACT|nr:MAG: hypothetical protein COV72_06805 [Candidatus Omnitrophica bacterium CG11_big_fil_rev_8_21_14_0_20_42_13]
MLNHSNSAKNFLILTVLFAVCHLPSAICHLSAADSEEPIVVDGDTVEMISSENKVNASGNVVIIYKESKLTCDKISVNTITKDAEAFGNVRIETDSGIILADEARYNLNTKKGFMRKVKIMSPPFYARADYVEKVSDIQVKMYNGYFTTCDKEKPHYRLRSKMIDFVMGERISAHDLSAMLYNSSLFYLPQYVHPLSDKRPRVTVTPGMSKDWGVYMLSAWRYYINDNFMGRIHLDYRERKDFASGFDTKYDTKLFGEGFLRAYYTHERDIMLKRPWKDSLVENVKEELLKQEVEEVSRGTTERERFRISLRHNWDIDETSSLKLEYNRLSDAEFLQDYFLRESEIVASSNTYALFTKLMPFSTLSVLAEKRVNRFNTELEKLPEIKWDISSSEIGDTNFYYSGTQSAANLNNKTASPSDIDENVNRIDSLNKLSYPKKIAFIETTPYVSGRWTYYTRDLDSDSDEPLRGIFATGIDMSTKFYRIFDIDTDFLRLDIHKLRHVITPSIRYDYTHSPTVPSEELYAFDALDSVTKSNVATLGLENKLQTKRNGENVDLVRFIMSSSYAFKQEPQGSRFGDIGLDLEITPFSWVRFEADSTYDKDDRAFKTANFDLVLTGEKEEDEEDEYKFFFGAGYRYDRDNRNQFTTQLTYRLNKDWKFKVYERWERETGGIREQEYTIYKDLHCWRMGVTYNVRRDHGEEIFVVFTLKAFPEAGVEFNNSYHRPKAGSLSY